MNATADFNNELKGALFKNENKRPEKKDADYRGSATILGVDYWIDAWINTGKTGVKYMALKFKEKSPREPAPAVVVEPPPAEFDDAIPF